MLIYNITTKVDHIILNEWLQWQKEIHIPEIMATGLFSEHRFYKLLEHDDHEGGIFVTQFITSREDYDKYLLQYAPQLRQKSLDKWNDKVVSFRTLLQNVQ
jgi:hypothetical protein